MGRVTEWVRLPLEAGGLMGRRLRILTELPTNRAGAPQDRLLGATDVIATEDGVAAEDHTVRVHCLGNPSARGEVRYEQLALYDDPTPWRRFPFDTVGLAGTTLHLLTAMPTDGVVPVDLPDDTTDVISLDDTPSVFLCLRVHPVADPDTVALVRYEQLALHDHQPGSDVARHPIRPDATGLTGTGMRHSPDRIDHHLVSHTDVICLDDTPSRFGSLRVHRAADPDRVIVTPIAELTVYFHQR
ncbi:hypothetical protein BH09ACT8_BH09ACT8_66570 [soil metagenome]